MVEPRIGPLQPGLPNQPYDEYVFSGSVDALAGERSVDLEDIVLPIVFSPWVLDDDDGGNWRAVLDPAASSRSRVRGCQKNRRHGSVESSTDEPCGGLTFALSTYSSPDGGGEGQETPTTGDRAPAVLLLEISFSAVGSVEAGGRVEGGGPRGEIFRVRHVAGASLDFVGPTVGALECVPEGVVGTVVTASRPPSRRRSRRRSTPRRRRRPRKPRRLRRRPRRFFVRGATRPQPQGRAAQRRQVPRQGRGRRLLRGLRRPARVQRVGVLRG